MAQLCKSIDLPGIFRYNKQKPRFYRREKPKGKVVFPMKCMYCGAADSRVVDSRPADDGASIRRRRECISCGRRFTTYEKIEMTPVMVVKRDGSRQLFDVEKVRSGVIKACEKCKVSAAQMDDIVNQVEKKVHNTSEHELPSTEIGELVMEALLKTDPVAYIRFASVHRELNDLSKLMAEMNKLMDKKE